MTKLSLIEEIAQKLKEGMIKDFNDLYVKEFTTEWKLERWCRKTEINLMTVDNSVDSIINLMLAKVEAAGLTPEKALAISTEVLGMDCVRKIGEENPIIGYKVGQIQKATAKAQLQAIKDRLEGK